MKLHKDKNISHRRRYNLIQIHLEPSTKNNISFLGIGPCKVCGIHDVGSSKDKLILPENQMQIQNVEKMLKISNTHVFARQIVDQTQNEIHL